MFSQTSALVLGIV